MDEQPEIYLEIAAHADHAIAGRRNGRRAVVPFHPSLEASEAFAQPATALRSAATDIANIAVKRMPKLTAAGWSEVFADGTGRPLFQAAAALHRAAMQHAAALDEWRTAKLKPISPVDPAIASETRAWLRSLKTGERIKIAISDATIAEAVFQAPHLAELPASLLPQIEDVVIRARLVASFNHNFRLTPDAANPFANGPDREAADRAATESFALQQARRAEVDTAKATFGNVVDFTAIVGDMSRESAFNAIMEAA